MGWEPNRRTARRVVVVAGVASAWCLATLAYVLIRCAIEGLTFAGPSSPLFPQDQLRYLAWIREAGLHGLIADPYQAGAAHVYLQPVFLVSGLLWRAGLSIQAAYLVWTPVALIVLVLGYARFAARFLPPQERAATLVLGLLYLSPLVPLFDYGGVVNANGANELIVAAGHGAAYWQAWGYLPTVIALGLMPVFLLGLEAIARGGDDRRLRLGVPAAGLLVSWLHPWGGIELALVTAGLIGLRGFAGSLRRVAIPGVAVLVPLVYYVALARQSSTWSLSHLRAAGAAPLIWPLIVAFVPLALAALPARRVPRDRGEQILVLWPLAALLCYIGLGPGARGPALEGVSLPLAVLAVRGWRELHASRTVTITALTLAIVPGAFYSAHTFRDIYHDRDVPFALALGEQRAVDGLARSSGKVLATPYLYPALPALADVTNGQAVPGSNALFTGELSPPAVRAVIAAAGASTVVSDCLPGRADLTGALAPLGFRPRRDGCERVYVRAPHRPRG